MAKRKCSFRQPPAEHVTGATPDRWIIRCPCGMTFFGNTEDQAADLWCRHATKEAQR